VTAQTKVEKPKVYAAIAAVTEDLAKVGIGKDRTNSTPGANYKFRGIDDVYNSLAPLLAKHKLNILPRVLSRETVERRSARGNALFYVTVEAEFDFVSAEDGSMHTVKTFGEAMDTGDKATNKAMSAAYKYAAFQAFCIPTEGDNDADSTTHEVASDGLIDDAQFAALVTMAESVGADVQRFCSYMKVPSLKAIKARDYDRAMAALKAKAKPVQEAA
jgi:hypothetical protein